MTFSQHEQTVHCPGAVWIMWMKQRLHVFRSHDFSTTRANSSLSRGGLNHVDETTTSRVSLTWLFNNSYNTVRCAGNSVTEKVEMSYIDFCTISILLQHSLVKSEPQPCLFSNNVITLAQEISNQAHVSLQVCIQRKHKLNHPYAADGVVETVP